MIDQALYCIVKGPKSHFKKNKLQKKNSGMSEPMIIFTLTMEVSVTEQTTLGKEELHLAVV